MFPVSILRNIFNMNLFLVFNNYWEVNEVPRVVKRKKKPQYPFFFFDWYHVLTTFLMIGVLKDTRYRSWKLIIKKKFNWIKYKS